MGTFRLCFIDVTVNRITNEAKFLDRRAQEISPLR